MKLLTFKSHAEAPPHLGVAVGDCIVDLTQQLANPPANMQGLIEGWTHYRAEVTRIAAVARPDLTLAEATLLAPVQRPGKILGIGLNYADHVAESGMAKPEHQLWFAKMPTSVQPPYGIVELPKVSAALDYEAELAFVIGKRCRHVPRAQAAEVIFGYCAANDVSVRDWQLRTSQFMLGKSFDTHCPFGPWIVTPDELGDPHQLNITCTVNGEVRQHSNTEHLIFRCADMIEHLSQVMTLEPGDLILTGTPGGVGAGFTPPRWLTAGDVVEVVIDKIGTLRHVVTPES